MDTLGLIAGNGRFPFLLLDAARAHGLTVVVAAIKEETDPEIERPRRRRPQHHASTGSRSASSPASSTPSSAEGVTRAVMAGQVKHTQIFSSIRPDWRLAKLLLNLRTRNTDMLLGAVAKVLGDEGIELISSTHYLEPLLAPAASSPPAPRRGRAEGHRLRPHRRPRHRQLRPRPDRRHRRPGLRRRRSHGGHRRHHPPRRRLCAHSAQTTIRNARHHPQPRASPSSKSPSPIRTCASTSPSSACPPSRPCAAPAPPASAIEAGRTLLFDRQAMIAAADAAGIAIIAQ